MLPLHSPLPKPLVQRLASGVENSLGTPTSKIFGDIFAPPSYHQMLVVFCFLSTVFLFSHFVEQACGGVDSGGINVSGPLVGPALRLYCIAF